MFQRRGDIGETFEMGSGSFSRIAEATLMLLFPSKARLPVAIS